MLILQAILIVQIIISASCECILTSFWEDLVNEHYPSCFQDNFYIRGFRVNHFGLSNDDDVDTYFDGAKCCSPPPEWGAYGALVEYADWKRVLDSENVFRCPMGFFMNGFYRDKDGLAKNFWYVFKMTRVRCAKPAGHPFYYGECYTQETAVDFAFFKGSYCRVGYYVTGIITSGSNRGIYGLHSIRCCSMATKHQVIHDIEDVKTIIMERTLVSMAQLADGLGYMFCSGHHGLYCGEEFVRINDTWTTIHERFSKEDKCSPPECTDHKRLQIVYSDWNLLVKDITYGVPSTDNYKLETIDSGTIYNYGNTNVIESFEISKTLTDSVTNFVETSITNHDGTPLGFSFKVNKLPKVSGLHTDNLHTSNLTNYTRQQLDSRTYTQSSLINLTPFTSASYNVTVTKTRTTIPYTAVVIGTFSAELQGYLKWDDKNIDGPSINYHHRYQREKNNSTFDYRFGDELFPFYRALRKERDTQASPWLWNEILKNSPETRHVIDRLIDERFYEFKINGTLEMISGVNIEVIWS